MRDWLATSWALQRSASLSAICSAAMWLSVSMFSRFYHLNVGATPSFGEQGLCVSRQYIIIFQSYLADGTESVQLDCLVLSIKHLPMVCEEISLYADDTVILTCDGE